jgi:hypothetical protein
VSTVRCKEEIAIGAIERAFPEYDAPSSIGPCCAARVALDVISTHRVGGPGVSRGDLAVARCGRAATDGDRIASQRSGVGTHGYVINTVAARYSTPAYRDVGAIAA